MGGGSAAARPVGLALAVVVACATGPLAGQGSRWTAGIVVGTARFAGASSEITPSPAGFRFAPYRPVFYGLFLERGSNVRVGLRVATASSAVSLEGHGPAGAGGGTVSVVAEGAFRVASVGALVSAPVFRVSPSASVRAGLGGHWERWTSLGETARSLVGLDGSAQFELSLGRHWVTHVSAGAGFDPRSPFAAGDLPNGFEPAHMWRVGFGAGMGYRW
ncbi:MAG: hypothetical protein ABI647_13595 [Gemmatimonadota bacterium]